MRAPALILIVAALAPVRAFAQEATDAAPVDPTVAAPPATAPAVAATPPPPAPVQAAPVQAAPVQAAPVQAAPVQAPPPQIIYVQPAPQPAPPAQTFAPQQSPLIAPQPAAPTNVYVTPPAQQYAQPYQLPPPSWAPRYPTQSEASPYVLPPLPPGYVYMPVPSNGSAAPAQGAAVPARDQLYLELQRVDARIEALQRQHVSVGGPITFMVLGYGTTALAGIIGLANFGQAERIQHKEYDTQWDRNELDYNDDGRINGRDAHLFRRAARISGVIAGVGLLVGIGSTRRLVQAREVRRARASELKSLSSQRENLRRQLSWGASAAPGQVGLSVQGQF